MTHPPDAKPPKRKRPDAPQGQAPPSTQTKAQAQRDAAEVKRLMTRLANHGWSDVLSGVGDPDRDMLMRLTFGRDGRMMRPALDAIYETGGVGAAIIDLVADDATRPRFTLEADDDLSGVEKAMRHIPVSDGVSGRRFGARLAINRALKLARLYGGAAIIVSARDGAPASAPLDKASLLSVDRLLVHNRHELRPLRYNLRGEVVTYQLHSETAHQGTLAPEATGQGAQAGPDGRAGGLEVHASRVFPVFGTELAAHRSASVNGWGDSVLERVMRELRSTMFVEDHATRTTARKNVPVLFTDGLDEMLSKDPQAIRAKARIMMEQMSLLRLLLLDGRDKMQNFDTSLAGFSDLLDAFPYRLAAAARIPVTRLYGMSPAGFSTGDTDQDLYYNLVQGSAVDLYVQPFYQWVAELLMLAQEGPTQGQAPEVWELTCGPLREPTQKERTEAVTAATNNVTALYSAGLLLPQEARANLREHYSLDDDAWAAKSSQQAQGISDEARIREARLAYPSGVLHLNPDVANPLRQMLGLPPWSEQDRADFLAHHGQAQGAGAPQEDGNPQEGSNPQATPNASPSLTRNAQESVWRRTWVPTAEMAEEARQGLELRKTFKRGGTSIGVRRATQLANRQPVRLSTIRRMVSYFKRHAVDKQAPGWEDRTNPSAGWIAWLLWGGDAGKAWAERLWKQTQDERAASNNTTPPTARGGKMGQRGHALAHTARLRGRIAEPATFGDATFGGSGAVLLQGVRLSLHAPEGESAAQGCAVVCRIPAPLDALIYRDDPKRVPHMTLAYFPAVAPGERARFLEVLREAASESSGGRVFLSSMLSAIVDQDARTVFYQHVHHDTIALYALRSEIIEDARLYGWQATFPDEFMPHVTLAYADDPRATFAGQAVSGSWFVDQLEVWFGDEEPVVIPLGEEAEEEEEDLSPSMQ